MQPALVAFPAWDDSLFVQLNSHAHSAPFDVLFQALMYASNSKIAIALVLAGSLLAARGGLRRVLAVGYFSVGLTSMVVEWILKPWIHRPRPLDAGLPLRALVGLHHSFGFPSAHAANFAALAAALTLARMRGAPAAWVLAGLMGYGRIYVGAHRPLDVLAGWLLGALVGMFTTRALEMVVPGESTRIREKSRSRS